MRRTHSVSVVTVAVVVMGVGACGTARSAEAFCGVMEEHKARYLEAMATANESLAGGEAAGLVGGISQAISAMADLQQMWEELSDVAPEEIRVDVEAVRDANQAQLDRLEEAATNPLKALGSALVGGLKVAGPMGRVDMYTRQHCDGDAAAVSDVAAPLTSESAASPGAAPSSLSPADPTTTPTIPVGAASVLPFEEPDQLVDDGVLLDLSQDSATLQLAVSDKGGLPSVTIAPSLPDPFVVDGSARIFAGGPADSTSVVAEVAGRAPSDGLSPARSAHFLLTFDPETGQQLSEATLEEGSEVIGILDGLVVMLVDGTLVVRDARSAALVTEVAGVSDAHLGDRLVVVQPTEDIELARGLDPRTGKVKWTANGAVYSGPSGSRDLLFIGEAVIRIDTGERVFPTDTLHNDGSSLNEWDIVQDPITGTVVVRTSCGALAGLAEDHQTTFVRRCDEVDPELRLLGAFGGYVWATTSDERIVFSANDGAVIAKGWEYYPAKGSARLLLLNDQHDQTRLMALQVDPQRILELTQSTPTS